MTTTPDAAQREHVDAQQLSGYVEGRLPAARRAAIEAHLADCADCRADAVAALRARRAPVRAWRWVAPALAAAVIALLLIPRAMREPVTPDLERTAQGAPGLVLTLPDPGAALPLADVTLTWRAAAPGARYRVTVTTEDGARVHDASTGDTAVTVPATALRPGGRYLWIVDVLAADGTALSAPPRSFAVQP